MLTWPSQAVSSILDRCSIGYSRVPFLTTSIKRMLKRFRVCAEGTYAPQESSCTTLSDCCHGLTNRRLLVDEALNFPSNEMISDSVDSFKTSNLIKILLSPHAAVLLSQPISGFLSSAL